MLSKQMIEERLDLFFNQYPLLSSCDFKLTGDSNLVAAGLKDSCDTIELTCTTLQRQILWHDYKLKFVYDKEADWTVLTLNEFNISVYWSYAKLAEHNSL